ncbi:hypothetical protein [Halobacterium wangiae]|uniref:hypothetical protein n=1 Tax=Halobacterium wangiae TaxID=2902623 RepID=UPI001E448382|nr:hypothetical protein [Halobacterium wangiae]
MSDDEFDVDRLIGLLEDGRDYLTRFKRAVVQDESNEDLMELADDLWTVLDELEDVLETIDFDELPDAIDLEELPDAIDVENLPDRLLDEDEAAIDLTHAREAVNLRELWEAVDLTELYKQAKELDAATDDVMGAVGAGDDGDGDGDEDDGLLEGVVEMGEGATAGLGAAVSQAAIEEEIQDAIEQFREMLLSTHELLRKLYEKNKESLGQPGRQPDSLNPSAYSTLPPGPVPDSASTRTSTVPDRVKYSGVEPSRRIYGRRFEREQKRRQADSDERTDDETATESDQSDAEDEEVTTTDD